jgi:hypothetical protein
MVPTLFLLLFALGAASGSLQAAEADASKIHQDIRDRHLPYGAIVDPVFAAPESLEITGYTRCGDSAIWTGHYLAAESYRWAVTRAPEAREGVMTALNGVRRLVEATGNDLLARCAIPADSPWAAGIASEESAHGVHSGIVDGQSYLWVGNTSRDQYLGVFFGLTAAWQLVDDQEVRDWVSMLATRMLKRLRDDQWNVVMPGGGISTTFLHRAEQRLALLKLGRRCNPREFETSYKTTANLLMGSIYPPILVETREPHDSYFKFNLSHIAFYNLLTSGDNRLVRSRYQSAFDLLRAATQHHDNAFFDMIDVAVNGRTEKRDERVRRLLEAWLGRPRRDLWVDLRSRYVSCEGDNRACEVVPVEERTPTDFLWQRSPYQLWGGLYGTIEGAGIDYILPYWMARYHGVVPE